MKTVTAALLTLSLLCGAVQTALAQEANVRIYGLVDVFGSSANMSGSTGRATVINSGGMTTSYWGVGGTEALGGGLSAQFALEGFFRADTGDAGRVPGEAMFSRAAYVGLSDRWGTVRMGRLSDPLFLATANMNPFGNSTRLSPLVDHLWSVPFGAAFAGDTGWNNALAYLSPNMDGFSLVTQYSLGETRAANSYGDNKAAVLRYVGPALSATLAGQQVKNGLGVSAAMPGQTAYFGGLSYDFKVIKLYGSYDRTHGDLSGRRTRTSHLGLAVPAGAGNWMLDWAHSQEESAVKPSFTRNTAGAGYDYNLSVRTDLYSVFLYDKLSTSSVGNTLAIGARHKF